MSHAANHFLAPSTFSFSKSRKIILRYDFLMRQALPPLNALKAFDATARHGTIKAAADELCVTPGAVSQMLKTLETHLGVALFERAPRGVFLTAIGRDYLPPIRQAMRLIAEASAQASEAHAAGSLTVSTTPFFAASWLLPHLPAFQALHPDIDLQISSSAGLVQFARDGIDVAIRHGLGRYPGLRSDRVLTVAMIAVATPALVDRLGMPHGLHELTRWPRVHGTERTGWRLWLQAQGVLDADTRGPSFDDAGLMLKAVLLNQGAGLLPEALVAREIAEGQLVPLAPAAHAEEFAYYLVCPEHRQHQPKVVAFREWLLGLSEGEPANA